MARSKGLATSRPPDRRLERSLANALSSTIVAASRPRAGRQADESQVLLCSGRTGVRRRYRRRRLEVTSARFLSDPMAYPEAAELAIKNPARIGNVLRVGQRAQRDAIRHADATGISIADQRVRAEPELRHCVVAFVRISHLPAWRRTHHANWYRFRLAWHRFSSAVAWRSPPPASVPRPHCHAH